MHHNNSSKASGDVGFDVDNRCRGCRTPLGTTCPPPCPASGVERTLYLAETLPGGVGRQWLMAGLKYTATPARRARVVALMDRMRWVRPVDQPLMPFSIGLLVKSLITDLRLGPRVSSIGYNPLATLRVPDCACRPEVCRCDEPDHPFQQAHPDLWPKYPLFALHVRWADAWQTMWWLDTGVGAVWLLEEETTAPIPDHMTVACWLEWCDHCSGHGTPPAEDNDGPHPCSHVCHQPPATPGADGQEVTV